MDHVRKSNKKKSMCRAIPTYFIRPVKNIFYHRRCQEYDFHGYLSYVLPNLPVQAQSCCFFDNIGDKIGAMSMSSDPVGSNKGDCDTGRSCCGCRTLLR